MNRISPTAVRRLPAMAAVLAFGIVLSGCAAVDEASGHCSDLRDTGYEMRDEMTALADEIKAGKPDTGLLELKQRTWANLVLGDPECFPEDNVAGAKTVIEVLGG